ISQRFEELHPCCTADIYLDDKVIGVIGELHAVYRETNDLKQTVVFELNLDEVLAEKTGNIVYEFLSKYPSISRDVALEVDNTVLVKDIEDLITDAAPNYLQAVYPFDVYEGEHIEEGKKSVALRLTYLNKEDTLTDRDVESVHQKVLDALLNKGYIVR